MQRYVNAALVLGFVVLCVMLAYAGPQPLVVGSFYGDGSGLTNLAALGTNGGTVTSVGMTVPGGLTISGSPITAAGTLAVGATAVSGVWQNNGSGGTSWGNLPASAFPAMSGVVTTPGGSFVTSFGSFNSATIGAAISDKTGSGLAVFNTSPTIATPTISSASVSTFAGFNGSGVLGSANLPSSALRSGLTDPTGTGSAVFGTAPTFSGVPIFSGQTANTILGLGGSQNLKSVALSGLTFDGTTLTSNGGSPVTPGVDILVTTSSVFQVAWNTDPTNVDSVSATNGSVVGFVGNGLVYSNVNGLVTLNGSLQSTNIITSVAFTSPTNTSTDGYVLTATGTGGTGATAWKIAGGGGGTGIQTNAGTGQFNIFTNATMVQNTNGGVPLSVVQSLTSTTNAEVIYSAQPGFIATYDLQSNLFGVFGMQTNQGTGLSTGILLTNQQQGQSLVWRTNGNFAASGIVQGSYLYATNAGFKAGWLVNPTGTNVQITSWNTNSGGVNLTNTFVQGSLGTDNINLQSANTNGVATFQVSQDGITWANAAGLTNYAYLMPTNNAGGNAMVSGSPGVASTYYDTNFTVNTTLAAMSFWANGVSSIFIHATVSGGTDRTLTFPGGCNSLQWGTPAVITVTNGQGAEIEVRSKYGSWTNVFWSPTAK